MASRFPQALEKWSWDSVSGVIPRPPHWGGDQRPGRRPAGGGGTPFSTGLLLLVTPCKDLKGPQTTVSACSPCAIFPLDARGGGQTPSLPSRSSGGAGTLARTTELLLSPTETL